MEVKPNNEQSESQEPTEPETGEPRPQETTKPENGEPQPKTWQEYGTKVLYFLRDWFLKLTTSYKIIVILFIVIILVLILLAYLGVFGQELANLMKQLVNKIMEMAGSKKS